MSISGPLALHRLQIASGYRTVSLAWKLALPRRMLCPTMVWCSAMLKRQLEALGPRVCYITGMMAIASTYQSQCLQSHSLTYTRAN